MISKIGSLQSSQAATQARRVEAKPVQTTQRNTNTETAAPRAAAVVQIGGQARALAAQNEASPQARIAELGAQRAQSTQSVARPRLGESSEARTEIEIEPVVAQPVPDFSASREATSAVPTRSVEASGAASDASSATQASSGRSYIA